MMRIFSVLLALLVAFGLLMLPCTQCVAATGAAIVLDEDEGDDEKRTADEDEGDEERTADEDDEAERTADEDDDEE